MITASHIPNGMSFYGPCKDPGADGSVIEETKHIKRYWAGRFVVSIDKAFWKSLEERMGGA